MSNDIERLPNHDDAGKVIQKLEDIKNAILGTAGNGEATMSMAKILANIRNGGGPTNLPVGSELTFSESPSLSTIIAGNTVENVTSGVTSETVNVDTFVAKAGTSSGVSISFYYYGSAWHKDSITGDIVTLADYGVTITGTPKANDYVTVALATSDFVMQVADYDHYTLKNSAINHHAVLVTKNCVRNAQQFCNNPQLAISNYLLAIAAGKKKFTTKTAGDNDLVADGTWVFTLTKDVPVGGGIYINKIGGWYDGSNTVKATNVPTQAVTYAADHSTIIETVNVTAYDSSNDTDAVDVGTFSREYDATITYKRDFGLINFARRVFYGSGDYGSSLYRQWVNATGAKGTWLKIVSVFDIKPSNGWTDQVPGYAHAMDSDLMGAIRHTFTSYYMSDSDYALMTALGLSVPPQYLNVPGVTVSGRKITCEDIFFPLSIVEVGLGNQWSDDVAGNLALKLFANYKDSDRIKYFGTTARYYWLRSTIPWNCGHTAYVTPTGALSFGDACDAGGVVPACTIG